MHVNDSSIAIVLQLKEEKKNPYQKSNFLSMSGHFSREKETRKKIIGRQKEKQLFAI